MCLLSKMYPLVLTIPYPLINQGTPLHLTGSNTIQSQLSIIPEMDFVALHSFDLLIDGLATSNVKAAYSAFLVCTVPIPVREERVALKIVSGY